MNTEKTRFKKNLYIAIVSQLVSSGAGITISFIVPRFLGVREYGFWQLFLFYVAYVNAASLGLFDGLYLKRGGDDYDTLDTSLIGTEWRLHILLQILIGLVLAVIVLRLDLEIDRKVVLLTCCFCIPIINSNDYIGKLLQAVNRTSLYSVSVILFNAMWFVGVAVMYAARWYSYKIIVLAYVIGHILAGIYLNYHAKNILFAPRCRISEVISDMKENIRVGICLFAAGYASSLIIGSVQFLVDRSWGIEVFGKVSFALSITYFFLRFISQVSMVLFPALRRIDEQQSVDIYISLNKSLDLLLPIILMGYFPIKLILSIWLPQYRESMNFLLYILPICIFDGKMQLLFDTYYKVLREEKKMLWLNVSAMFFSIVITIITLQVTTDLTYVLIGIIITLALRSLRAYMYLCSKLQIPKDDLFLNLITVTVFIGTAVILEDPAALFVYVCFYCVILYLHKQEVKTVLSDLKGFIKK
ncbi:MAG: hypothetical protein Q4B03_08320 [Lachnospiraceae bacterium]|nr:hypothetical protein [Lachnospiraceae bacterium]